MAIHRGIQSAIFYYLSCAPCAEARYRKKRKEEAQRDRLQREALKEELPELYEHPSPSSTNPHWDAEIALGPSLVARGRRKVNTADGQRGLKIDRVSSNDSRGPSLVHLPPGSSSDVQLDARCLYRPSQRDDEKLWGSSSMLGDPTSLHESPLQKPARVLTRDSGPEFRDYRNPAINDMHPATVTRVQTRADVLWMMQPPPVADVMSGKLPPSRGRADSGGISRSVSYRSGISSQHPTSIRKGSRASQPVSPAIMAREISSGGSNMPLGQPHDRNHATATRDFAVPSPPLNAGEQRAASNTPLFELLPPAAASTQSPLILDPTRPHARRLSRPTLHNILSDSALLTPSKSPQQRSPTSPSLAPSPTFTSPQENTHPSSTSSSSSYHIASNLQQNFVERQKSGFLFPSPSRSNTAPYMPLSRSQSAARAPPSATTAVYMNSASIKIMHDLHQQNPNHASTPSSTKVFATAPLFEFPPRSSQPQQQQQQLKTSRQKTDSPFGETGDEDSPLNANSSLVRPEIFDSWYTPDFELPKWVLEHTKREVRERWSMDL